jgi:hypothetical protein
VSQSLPITRPRASNRRKASFSRCEGYWVGIAKLDELRERIFVVSADCDPPAALHGRLDGVKADSYLSFEVTPDGVWCKAEALACCLIGGVVVVVSATFRVWPVGLEGAGSPIHEEAELIWNYSRWKARRRILWTLASK